MIDKLVFVNPLSLSEYENYFENSLKAKSKIRELMNGQDKIVFEVDKDILEEEQERAFRGESVDVVAEMEEELAEHKEETARLFEEVTKRDAYINYVQRETAIIESVKDLTESQKEKVIGLVEGMDYSDAFGTKLTAIVEMVKGSTKEEAAITENINTVDNDAAGLNFVAEAVDTTTTQVEQNSNVSLYAKVASRF